MKVQKMYIYLEGEGDLCRSIRSTAKQQKLLPEVAFKMECVAR